MELGAVNIAAFHRSSQFCAVFRTGRNEVITVHTCVGMYEINVFALARVCENGASRLLFGGWKMKRVPAHLRYLLVAWNIAVKRNDLTGNKSESVVLAKLVALIKEQLHTEANTHKRLAFGNFFKDNGERAIFFARGVLETVKKLRWAPDVIHCQGWISHVLPLYLKKAYIDDPIFSNSKVVLSLYNDAPDSFPEDLKEKVLFGNVTDKDVEILTESTGINLAKLAASYSDGVILGADGIPAEVTDFCKNAGLPVLPYNAEAVQNGSYIEDYNSFYDNL